MEAADAPLIRIHDDLTATLPDEVQVTYLKDGVHLRRDDTWASMDGDVFRKDGRRHRVIDMVREADERREAASR